ncbi:tRNA uridine-5-carboxymethylaminomethyl(34) synthesis GTPase MnmE [Mycoplasmopsis pullorum]|uniref:tRNA uridine-5-carboxymethylaminomethyl(34) synthesis GTPase MnmE n=1 Tax=Mycoplasmopsis pullorum TaxID=48003 RepID=UPI001118E669|nr:tRNA uridine-5-carboxymethylaminomethyl(34) synthesis GTPase MnmE [Mycoplasmopsis pullorum]TNK83799.1 tRNA uridine-5-carboxymethylaminomethyl(34) synthesis GTPase MnmE [Mycoplasmopsis pullorum]TNK91973.1 tRNA uridine-5-carboxymethylaminomethyl(34) synthesis GTPase MnmE [Mycoplasmopsis pullorum]
MFDNIAAISSGANVNQAISIVRVTGPDAVEIVKKIYKGRLGKDHQITYGHIYDFNDKMVDEVLVMWFTGREKDGQIIYNNYVGEPLIEINCHGGVVVTNQILELLLASGARLAEPGEFTRRAFLNGKMDLVKAEAVHDLIMAKTTKQTALSISKFSGKTSSLIENLSDEIAYIIGLCEVNIDYPEYDDIEILTDEILLPKVKDLITKIKEIIKVSESSRYIFEGVNVAILGKPNVGKSSLLNALLSEEKAIVTDIAGTTRDLVEASYQIEGILFKLIDTAGLRKTDEKIESIGIKKSLEQIERADLIIHVLDPTQENNEFDSMIEQKSKELNKIYIKVINKKDLINTIDDSSVVYTSAINNQIETLEKALVEKFSGIDIENDKILSNTRQLALIKECLNHLNEAKNSLENFMTFDVVIVDIANAWDSLQNIRGKANREDLLDKMFKTFCLGK